jgi:hypothetical protein
MRRLYNVTKPLPTIGPHRSGFITNIDSRECVGGPVLSSRQKVRYNPYVHEPKRHDEMQQFDAAGQWSNPDAVPALKSWYYPVDAFSQWPEKTDIKCWWCSYGFSWTPFPLPYSYDRSSSRYRVRGIFCGPSCAKAYATHDECITYIAKVLYFIDQIAREFFGYDADSCIKPAPPRELLKDYCGENGFSIEQFRSVCACGRSIKLLPPGFITIKQVVEAEQKEAHKRVVFHVENPDDIESTDVLVKQKRIPFVPLGRKTLCNYFKTKT